MSRSATCNADCTDTVHSGSCRAKQSRARQRDEKDRAHANKEPVRVTDAVRTAITAQPLRAQPVVYMIIPDIKVYGRPAVVYTPDTYATRPEPDNPTDIPCPDNRCAYTRLDGTKYMIDACGQSFDRINGQYQPDVRPRRPA